MTTRIKTISFKYLYIKQMACYCKKLSTVVKASTIIMLKYSIHKLGRKSPMAKILNNRLGITDKDQPR